MQKHLNKKTLDEIGKVLIKADARRRLDVEKIVAMPELFDSVRARIAAEKVSTRRKLFGAGRLVATGFASVVVAFAVLALTFGVFTPGTGEIARRQIQAPQHLVEVPKSRDPDVVAAPLPPQVDTTIRPQRALFKTDSKPVKATRTATREANVDDHFYAVSYAGDPNETDRGGRIIRVDMPRSALFAMGVNIPLENEAELIKTDLLVGPDGVTRGIRVVK